MIIQLFRHSKGKFLLASLIEVLGAIVIVLLLHSFVVENPEISEMVPILVIIVQAFFLFLIYMEDCFIKPPSENFSSNPDFLFLGFYLVSISTSFLANLLLFRDVWILKTQLLALAIAFPTFIYGYFTFQRMILKREESFWNILQTSAVCGSYGLVFADPSNIKIAVDLLTTLLCTIYLAYDVKS